MKSQRPTVIPLTTAIMYIALSTLLISGSALLLLFGHRYLKNRSTDDPSYLIASLLQSPCGGGKIPSPYLAELLDLSCDRPTHLYEFDSGRAKAKLQQCPLIKSVTVKKIKPSTIFINYTLRQPIAYIGDYDNCAIDSENVLFPYTSFYTPKNLPEIIYGAKYDGVVAWGERLNGNEIALALKLLQLLTHYFATEGIEVVRIDTSKAFAPRRSEREIVIILREWIVKPQGDPALDPTIVRYLRLDRSNFSEQLANYLLLRKRLTEETVIDMRISQLAFISKSE